jgi:hypothetical protein
MSADRLNDLLAFKGFLEDQLTRGGPIPTVDEAIALWEFENAPESEKEETLRAIQRGFDDLQAGRTVDAFESAARLSQKIESIARQR